MDAALAFDAGDTRERRRHHADMEMGFTGAAIETRRAGMARMGGTFVGDFEGGRRESDGQLVADGFGYAHAERVRGRPVKVKIFLSLFFHRPIP
jgi:hypothetical protein